MAQRVVAWRPDLVGLSMLFTSRSHEFVALARSLRGQGFRGHLTAGGHFASLHARELLEDQPAFDSIVGGEGEEVLAELASSLAAPMGIPGLTCRDADGVIRSTGPRPNLSDLDGRPWPTRPRRFHRYNGLPIANMLAGRGCHGSCHFCSIHAFHQRSGGPRFRLRDPRCVAREMAALYHDRGVRIFNFQDDNFFLPAVRGNMERLSALRAAMEAEGIGRVAIQAKARPDAIDPGVLDLLVGMGLFRVFLGVETDAVGGLRRLGRGIGREQNHRALSVLRERDIHTCFNLLMFDPESDIASLRQNVAFMARQRVFPLNFCRVEVYAGTALERRLRAEGRLEGDYMGQTYAIADPAAQCAYEMFWRVFARRNFGQGGMHHESMRVDYHLHLLRHFHPSRVDANLWRRAKALVADLNRDSAERLGALLDIAECLPSRPALEEAAAEAKRARARADRGLEREAAALLRSIQERVEGRPRRLDGARRSRRAVAAAILVSAWVGADTALAQDDGEGTEQESSGAPQVIKPEPVPLDENPFTHMCEAAPPPYDLIPPTPLPDPSELVLSLESMQDLRMAYEGECSARVRFEVDDGGRARGIVVTATPRRRQVVVGVVDALIAITFGQEYRDHGYSVLLWNQVVPAEDASEAEE